MSAMRALLQSMPPLFEAQNDLEEHVRDLEDTEDESALDALLLASLEETLMTAELAVKGPTAPPKAGADRVSASPSLQSVAPVPTATAPQDVPEVAPAVQPKAEAASAARPTDIAKTSDMPDVAAQQLATHRADLASVDQKLAFIDIDLDQAKVQLAEVTQALKLHHAQKACLVSLRRAHTQFITRCSKEG